MPNPHADEGQLSSLLVGLAAAGRRAPDLEGELVTPVDIPLVSPAVMAHLIERAGTSGAAILRATHANRHGHPVLFIREVFEELRNADPSVGAKAILRRRPDRVLNAEVDDAGVIMDVDTAADYERMFGRTIEPL